jgi:hypothetical protein
MTPSAPRISLDGCVFVARLGDAVSRRHCGGSAEPSPSWLCCAATPPVKEGTQDGDICITLSLFQLSFVRLTGQHERSKQRT